MKRLILLSMSLATVAFVGCQQKMADQPAMRPYEQFEGFAHQQSIRPLEKGVIHRNQPTSDDPLVTWLTAEGKNPQVSADWKATVDPNGATAPSPGALTSVKNYVSELPIQLTEADLKRGQSLYNANCALCHGAGGYGNGKIAERGPFKPPSYHLDPNNQELDQNYLNEIAPGKSLPVGYSRGFDRYGERVSFKDVPIGYIFQVITWGYGIMGSHDTQLPDPVDRWRVAAYVKTLIYSRSVPVDELPEEAKQKLEEQAKGGNN